ncbi:MAG TPA: DUF3999 family protein [Armatimonadota bacterium]|nr:DUF3999 family protein [Armatimonadota bacterium]
MKARHRIVAALIGCLCAGGLARADFQPRKWQYYSEIAPGRGGKYAQIILNRDVYCRSKDDLADLRIIQGGREVPYKLLVDAGSTGSQPAYPIKVINKSIVPGKYSSFVVDLGKPGLLNNYIYIRTPSTNFTRKVEIEGGNDGVHWAILRNDGYIFDFSRDYHAQSLSVRYPENNYRYIRVKIWNFDEKPIVIDTPLIAFEKVEPAKEMTLFQGQGAVTQNAEEKSTDIVLDFGCHGLHGHRMVIASRDTNYNRWVEIAGSDDQKTWNDLGSGQILKYDTPKFKGAESSIEYISDGYRYIRARIRNYDDQPIRISKVTVYGIRHRLFFPHQAGSSYRLYYGNPEATAPTYDIEQTFKYLSSESAVSLKLGPSAKNPDFVMPIATRPWLEKNPWTLWVVLLLAVIFLGWLTVKSIIQTKAAPPSG